MCRVRHNDDHPTVALRQENFFDAMSCQSIAARHEQNQEDLSRVKNPWLRDNQIDQHGLGHQTETDRSHVWLLEQSVAVREALSTSFLQQQRRPSPS